MFKKYFKLSFSLAILVAILGLMPVGVGAVAITRVLDMGSRGVDVQLSQIALNLDSATRLTLSGEGAPGQETDYFGEKTRLAIIKFQKKYHIVGENGRIGPKTLQLINYLGPKLAQAKKEKTPLIPTDWPESGAMTTALPITKNYVSRTAIAQKVPLVVKKSVAPKLLSFSPQAVINGGTVTLRGEGFTKTGNNILTKYKTYENIPSVDGQTLSFVFSIPIEWSLFSRLHQLPSELITPNTSGPMSVWVMNKNGVSNELSFDFRLF